jgi:hypothetical protein
MYSFGGHFATGPFYVGLGYEMHQDFNPAAQPVGPGPAQYGGGDDTTLTAVVGLQFGGFNVRGMYSKSEYETTNTTNLDVDGFGVFADWNISGPHTLVYVIGTTPRALRSRRRLHCGTATFSSDTGADRWQSSTLRAFEAHRGVDTIPRCRRR